MPEQFPALVAAVCLTVYWFWVVVKLVRLARKIGKDPNALPREFTGLLMRGLWYPCIAALLIGLWVAACIGPDRTGHVAGRHGFLAIFGWFWRYSDMGLAGWLLAGAASVLCVACTAITFVCWRKMGRSWRIGIDPGEKLELVSTGPYRVVRHPIYALRMVINLCAFLMAPTALVLATAAIDCILLQIEARREERYMESKHGEHYARYKNSVGRFVPRAFVV